MRDALSAEPSLEEALRSPAAPPILAPLASPPLRPVEAEGLDLILEGFLLHHGRPRHLDIADRGRQVLAGDYCYATGLVRVAAAGDLFVIEALSELIAVSAGLVARGQRAHLEPLWRAAVAAIAARGAHDGPRLDERFLPATATLASAEIVGPIEALAASLDATPGLREALAV